MSHRLHDTVPVTLENLPRSHGSQTLALPIENVPGGHGVLTLVPSHMNPAGQTLQAVRVVMVPPDVNELGGHVRQVAAPFSLHSSSAPHSVQFAAIAADHVPARHGVHERPPPAALVPAAHAVRTLVPSHAYPGA